MTYAKDFIDLQLLFARSVAKIAEQPLSNMLLNFTNLYIRFGLGRDLNPEHPVWVEYLRGLHDADDLSAWTYEYYLKRAHVESGPSIVATFGCFSYEQIANNCIRLHFQNIDTEGGSSLSRSRVEMRRAELASLFAHVRATRHDDVRVVGVSWLYNLEAYRRLFPPSYVATARPITNRFHSMPLWGQFLDRYGNLKEDVTRSFVTRLAQQTSLDSLHGCFPFRIMAVEAEVEGFYEFYGIDRVTYSCR